jgi:hypothetical protein
LIEQISANQVIGFARSALGLKPTEGVDEAYIASLLRRAAGIFCPCSPKTLSAAVRECLGLLTPDQGSLDELVESCLEGLMVVGDLLELSQVSVDDPNVKGTWVFAAPPAFITRPSGSTFVIGISPDELTPLPATLASQIQYRSFTRVLPGPPESVTAILRDTGMMEMTTEMWLRSPKEEGAAALKGSLLALLKTRGPSGSIEELEVLDPQSKPSFYKGRWKKVKSQTGIYVARRPQAYGAPIWCVCRLEDGQTMQILDLPLNEKSSARWRGCDAAWHLQMAIDSCNGTPQTYRKRPASGGAILDFFSPLPLWARRRLTILGRAEPPYRSLFSYYLPQEELAEEETFMQRRLWLACAENIMGEAS